MRERDRERRETKGEKERQRGVFQRPKLTQHNERLANQQINGLVARNRGVVLVFDVVGPIYKLLKSWVCIPVCDIRLLSFLLLFWLKRCTTPAYWLPNHYLSL